jgi:hypothetical protein
MNTTTTGTRCFHGLWIGKRRGYLRRFAPPLCTVCSLSEPNCTLPRSHPAIVIQDGAPTPGPFGTRVYWGAGGRL